jgi:uncharacterized protein YbjQ (UPF0145 family)
MAIVCSRCGAKQGVMAILASDTYTCPKCTEEIAREKQRQEQLEWKRIEQVKREAAKVVLSSTSGLDGFRVKRYIGIESVEFVIGTGAFSEISASIADFFGARSSAFEKKLQAAKKHAMNALRFIAAEQGANAVIGVDLDYAEFTGNRVALIINGTLVEVEPIA